MVIGALFYEVGMGGGELHMRVVPISYYLLIMYMYMLFMCMMCVICLFVCVCVCVFCMYVCVGGVCGREGLH